MEASAGQERLCGHTIGDAVCHGHENDGDEGRQCLCSLLPLYPHHIHHHQRAHCDERRPDRVWWHTRCTDPMLSAEQHGHQCCACERS